MARSDLLLQLVRAGAQGNPVGFRSALEALVAEERNKQHHVLADRLAAHLNGVPARKPRPPNGGAAPSQVLIEVHPQRGFSDLVLPEAALGVCQELVEEHQRADLLRSHNLEPRNRVLLAGPPGNGKTSLAEALAAELAVPLLVVRYEAVIASYLGETAVRLARVFDEARQRRCVLFFDEFDVVGKERGDSHETGEIKRVVSSLLLQVDALPSHVVVVTASNHPELLDRAVWRRFQVRLELPAPTMKQTAEWFALFERRTGLALGLAPSTLAKKLRGLSFSELEQFGQDVQRRIVLGEGGEKPRRVVEQRLQFWRRRYKLPDSGEESVDA